MDTRFHKISYILIFSFLSLFPLHAQNGKYVGGDISLLPAFEQHNSPYLDGNNQPIDDLIEWLINECGWNTFRVRLFVNPDNSDPSVCQDLEYVKQLGKRIKDAGAYFMLDYHYSDTWVDATHIQAPAIWSNCTSDEKADSVYAYTLRTLQELVKHGASPDFVQIGNEIMYGFVGIQVHPYNDSNDDWDGYINVLKAGSKAVRTALPEAQIIVHTDRPSNAQYNKFYYGKLIGNNVDFDVIGLSYYPFWHGFLSDLKKGLDAIKTEFPEKTVQIVETGYYFQYWPTKGINYNTSTTWAATPAGQYKCMKDLIAFLANYPQVEGLLYWEPEDAGNGDDTNWSIGPTVSADWTNRGLWSPEASKTGHKPIKCADGMVHYLLGNYIGVYHSALENVTTKDNGQVKKIYQNGQILIEKNNTIYNLLGTELK